ncbi:NAD-dependent epimerase/dehydratase family protein [Anaeromicrobium sediminis]|uniref:Epimerase n=1 Tax=Anaeromicrobium sediminis TaxID=1478221 RepID=A0A267MP08_9FIRM|nr:NAD(P)-dependent oxidoreductase [Anaeromicrobium sediminis]PAB60648.1 epimerase [Anaeromicrobium sediminis]
MKKVLITGASGFIGTNTLNLLIEKGYKVHAVSSRTFKSKNNNVVWHCVDLTNLHEIDKLFREVMPTHLLHLAWDLTPNKYRNSPNNLIWVQSSIEIIKNFNKYGGERAVFAGTCFEYDLNYGYLNEHLTPLKACSLYGTCKASLHNIVGSYSIKNGLSLAWGRIFYSYGPHDNSNRVISYVISNLLKGEVAHCSHGNQIRDYSYVYDVASALIALLESSVEGAVNIGTGNPVKLKDIFMKISMKIGKQNSIYLGDVKTLPNEAPLIVADIKRLKDEVGWIPSYDLDKGLDETIEWWKKKIKV